MPAGNNSSLLLLALAFNTMPSEAQSQQHAVWDRFFFNVELPIKAMLPRGRMKLFVYHRYPIALHNLKVRAQSNLGWIRVVVKPPAIEEVEPTVIKEMTIHFHCQPMAAESIPDTAQITIEFESDELGKSKPVQLPIPLTAAGEREANELLSVPVGEIVVRVGGLERALYYGSLLCAIGLVGFLLYRKHRANMAW